VVNPTELKDHYGWADCVDGFIWVVKYTNKMHIVPIVTIVGPAHLVREDGASGSLDSAWIANNYVDCDTYRNVY
jgi:hypothetical protein